MVKIYAYEPIQGAVFVHQPLPEDAQTEQSQPQELMESERPTGLCLIAYCVVRAFTCLGDACVAICSCEEIDADY